MHQLSMVSSVLALRNLNLVKTHFNLTKYKHALICPVPKVNSPTMQKTIPTNFNSPTDNKSPGKIYNLISFNGASLRIKGNQHAFTKIGLQCLLWPFSFVGITYYVSKTWKNGCRDKGKRSLRAKKFASGKPALGLPKETIAISFAATRKLYHYRIRENP
jgi:hypothetical protein